MRRRTLLVLLALCACESTPDRTLEPLGHPTIPPYMGTAVITATTSDLPVIPPPSSLSPVPPSLVWLTAPTLAPVVVVAPPAPPPARPRSTTPPPPPEPEPEPVPATPAPTPEPTPAPTPEPTPPFRPDTTPPSPPSDPPPTPGTEHAMTTEIPDLSALGQVLRGLQAFEADMRAQGIHVGLWGCCATCGQDWPCETETASEHTD